MKLVSIWFMPSAAELRDLSQSYNKSRAESKIKNAVFRFCLCRVQPNFEIYLKVTTNREQRANKKRKMWYTPLGSRPASAECSRTY